MIFALATSAEVHTEFTIEKPDTAQCYGIVNVHFYVHNAITLIACNMQCCSPVLQSNLVMLDVHKLRIRPEQVTTSLCLA